MADFTKDDLRDVFAEFFGGGARGGFGRSGGFGRGGSRRYDDDNFNFDDELKDLDEERIERLKRIGATEKELHEMSKENYARLKNDLKDIEEKLKDENLSAEERIKYQKEFLKLKGKEIDYLEEQEKYEQNTLNRLGKIASGFKQIVKSIQKFNDAWAKADQAAANYTRTLGGTVAAYDRLRKNTIDNVVNKSIGINYNMSIDELLKAQEAYSKAVGRNLRLDNEQQESLAALSKVMGPEGANQLAVAFENFGVGLNDTGAHAAKMFKEASEYGISFDKYAQNVRENISLAQNYTFKNGLAGLESMAKKAAAIKLDMRQIEGFANKVNTIEGAIGTAAKLQVLGGPFAAMSNPLDMLNEGLTDMEGLADRFVNMTGGLGQFNKQKGEVEVSAFNKQRIRLAAEAMGMDYNAVMTTVMAKAKGNEIERQLRASGNPNGLNEKMINLIKNSATWENGKAGVSINGQFKTLDQLQNSDYGSLVKETQSEAEDIKDIAKMLRGLTDIREGQEKQLEATKAQMSENLGIGKGEKYILDAIGQSNFWLKIIASIQGISGILGGLNSMFGGRLGRWAGKNLWKAGKWAWNGVKKGGQWVGRGVSRAFGRAATGGAGRAVTTAAGAMGGGTALAAAGGMGAETAALAGTEAAALGGGTAATKAATTAATRTGGRVFRRGLERGFTRAAIKVGGKKFAQKALVKGSAKFLGAAAKGMANPLGIVGAVGDIGTDILVDTGAIKTGGAAHYGLKMASGALEYGAMGAALGSIIPGVGNLIGGAIGATVGAVKGFFQANAARRKKKWGGKVDKILAEKGLSLQGDYRGGLLKQIHKGLETGEISKSLEKKMIKRGDAEVVKAIKAVKEGKSKEGAEGEGVEKNVAEGYFTVENAYFGDGVAGGKSVSRGKVSEESEKTVGEDLRDSLSWGPLGSLAFLVKRIKHRRSEDGEEGGGSRFGRVARWFVPGLGIAGIAGRLLRGENSFKERPARVEEDENDIYNKSMRRAESHLPSSLNINVNGAIKLTDAQGRSFDIAGQLLKDTVFIRELTNLISKQMNVSDYGGNFVDKTAQKA